jgi:NTP pyrophosphatase (non-canonical NTP hydrolase)
MEDASAALQDFGNFCVAIWRPSGETTTADDLFVMGLGLPGECGEVAELLAEGAPSCTMARARLSSELGDTIYYWARIVGAYGMNHSDFAEGVLPEQLARTCSPTTFEQLATSALRLTAAIGRVAEVMKKQRRDGHLNEQLLRKSLREALIHWGAVCQQCELDWRDVLSANKTKLAARTMLRSNSERPGRRSLLRPCETRRRAENVMRAGSGRGVG